MNIGDKVIVIDRDSDNYEFVGKVKTITEDGHYDISAPGNELFSFDQLSLVYPSETENLIENKIFEIVCLSNDMDKVLTLMKQYGDEITLGDLFNKIAEKKNIHRKEIMTLTV